MNLIGNTCLSSFIIRDYIKIPYNNPFCWNVIDIDSFCYLIENYNKINFKDYELIKDSNWNFSLIIDKKIKTQYVHYKFSIEDKIIRKNNLDVYYNKIWLYIIEKYEKRLKIMLEQQEEPIFIIGSSYDKSFGSVDLNDIKKIINIKTKYKIIITSNIDLNFDLPSNIIYYKHSIIKNNCMLSKLLYNTIFCKSLGFYPS